MPTATTMARMAQVVEVTIKVQGGGDRTALRETETLRSSRLGARTGARGNGPGFAQLVNDGRLNMIREEYKKGWVGWTRGPEKDECTC
jgi:hypothetical protein